MSSGSRLILIPFALAAACFAGSTEAPAPARPECNAESAHQIWPQKADRRPGTRVEICVEKHSRYRWQPLTVDISELRAQVKSSAPNSPRPAKEPASAAARE